MVTWDSGNKACKLLFFFSILDDAIGDVQEVVVLGLMDAERKCLAVSVFFFEQVCCMGMLVLFVMALTFVE